MEPNLKDIDDYDKPLSHKKTTTIVVSFLGTLAIYTLFSYLINVVG